MAGERLARCTGPLHEIDHAVRQTGGSPAIHHECTNRRGQLGRLEDDGVPRQECRDDVAIGQVCREIIGAEHSQYAVRLVRKALLESVPSRLFGRCAFGVGGDRNIDLADDRRNLGLGFPERLAGFAGDQAGKGIRAVAYHRLETADVVDPHVEPGANPIGQRGPRRRNRSIDVAGLAAPEFCSGTRVGRDEIR